MLILELTKTVNESPIVKKKVKRQVKYCPDYKIQSGPMQINGSPDIEQQQCKLPKFLDKGFESESIAIINGYQHKGFPGGLPPKY